MRRIFQQIVIGLSIILLMFTDVYADIVRDVLQGKLSIKDVPYTISLVNSDYVVLKERQDYIFQNQQIQTNLIGDINIMITLSDKKFFITLSINGRESTYELPLYGGVVEQDGYYIIVAPTGYDQSLSDYVEAELQWDGSKVVYVPSLQSSGSDLEILRKVLYNEDRIWQIEKFRLAENVCLNTVYDVFKLYYSWKDRAESLYLIKGNDGCVYPFLYNVAKIPGPSNQKPRTLNPEPAKSATSNQEPENSDSELKTRTLKPEVKEIVDRKDIEPATKITHFRWFRRGNQVKFQIKGNGLIDYELFDFFTSTILTDM